MEAKKASASVANHVVISEVQIATDEFVELYNPTDSDIDITVWHWCYFSPGRNWNNSYRDKVFPSGSTIAAHGYYLIGLKGYPMPLSDWQPYTSAQLADDGSVGIFPWDPDTKTAEEAKAGRIDAVGWGSVDYVYEDKNATVPGSDKSLQRKVSATINEDGVHGPAWDTDNNSTDFFLQSNPNPQNSSETQYPIPEFSTILIPIIGMIVLFAIFRKINKKK